MAVYEINYTEEAADNLDVLKAKLRREIRDGIIRQLKDEPAVQTRNRKILSGGSAMDI